MVPFIFLIQIGPIYLPSDVFFLNLSSRRPFPSLFFFFGGGGQFVLCGGNQFILGSSGLHGDWRVICEP
jgi:hypothetical protein